MRILLGSSELFPYSKTGGLADMVGALAKYLAKGGHRVGVVTPLYRGIREKFPGIQANGMSINLILGRDVCSAQILILEPEEGLTIYFVDRPEFYQRPGLYQEGGADYWDNAERFLYLSKCVTALARQLSWKPELVHVHDWQVGMVPLLIRHQQWREGWFDAPKTCFTIHNQAYQGNFPLQKYELTNLPWDYFTPHGAEYYGGLSCLKAGMVYADRITTVSPRYAREITTEEYGYGLDGVLRERQRDLIGILNGVDYEEWKTSGNPFLKYSYSADDLSGKTAEKLELQKELGLPQRPDVPLFGTITRLVDQKGIDILLSSLEEMLACDMQFVLLGSGSAEYERAFRQLGARYPAKVAASIGYNHGLSHRIEAGCDFYLMPSRFEPCGLNQMYSLRYGTIPIVRATGGLDDSVTDATEDLDLANGVKFYEYSSRALAKAIRKALVLFDSPDLLLHYRINAIEADFSWERTAEEYSDMFADILQKTND